MKKPNDEHVWVLFDGNQQELWHWMAPWGLVCGRDSPGNQSEEFQYEIPDGQPLCPKCMEEWACRDVYLPNDKATITLGEGRKTMISNYRVWDDDKKIYLANDDLVETLKFGVTSKGTARVVIGVPDAERFQVEESTRFTDEDGREVFEGDMVSFLWDGTFDSDMELPERLGFIEYDNVMAAWMIQVEGTGVSMMLSCDKVLELRITGNANREEPLPTTK